MSNAADTDRVAELARQIVTDHDPKSVPVPDFLGACFDAGLSWVHFPEGLGGLGVSRGLQAVADGILQRAGGPVPLALNPMGYGMAAPTVREHAQTDEVKRRLLRRLATTEDIWCQLFSEPGAGSDLAGLATSAVPDGDEWVINGQKVWTSLAHRARWGLLLARTNPEVPKHKGLTYFVLDCSAWICLGRKGFCIRATPFATASGKSTTGAARCSSGSCAAAPTPSKVAPPR